MEMSGSQQTTGFWVKEGGDRIATPPRRGLPVAGAGRGVSSVNSLCSARRMQTWSWQWA